jgi:hypothetical protein
MVSRAMTKGYVYTLSNPEMRGILKIGMTDRTPEERVKELFTSGVPSPFKIEFAKKVKNPREKEATLHQLLENYHERVYSRREFFRVSPKEVYKFFELMEGEWWAEVRAEEEEDEEDDRADEADSSSVESEEGDTYSNWLLNNILVSGKDEHRLPMPEISAEFIKNTGRNSNDTKSKGELISRIKMYPRVKTEGKVEKGRLAIVGVVWNVGCDPSMDDDAQTAQEKAYESWLGGRTKTTTTALEFLALS